ncbi:hypothetical protein [Sphingomonas sp. HMP6]|uniref:hypothetical protein n=1 Tax=Sphingomonas sp. HMP6 TaxID=1517551 RepID=UPI001596A742|nr:hypothetical protein [Sphingomonas sp. HMP6]BCA59483.1 hypothetical protein HMP06_2252 [Sphingomonas sp. HMP6]
MATLAPFQTATPAMIVGYRDGDEPLPLELGEPFALLGGDRLGPDGIPFLVMHEHQPDFLAWVRKRCAAMLAAERPWFGGGTLILGGVEGVGRTHAARWLARVVGVPHAVLNLTNPVVAANVAASGEIGEAMGASPVTIAMATARCANPVVTVVGADRVGDNVLAGLAAMIDPERCRRWREDRLGIDVDLGEVTWILQRDMRRGIPSWVAPGADTVALRAAPSGFDHVLALSICSEAMGDLGIDPRAGTVSWQRIREQLPRYGQSSAKALYANIVNALRECLRPSETPIDHELF